MRTAYRLLALAGGLALAATVVLDLGWGKPDHVGWVLVGPLPFYVVGLVTFVYRPDNLVVRWLLVSGALFVVGTFLNETLLPLMNSPGLSLVAQWVSGAGLFVFVGLVGLFPVGRPDHRVDRVVLTAVAAAAVVVPVLGALANPTMLLETYADAGIPTTPSPIFVESLAPLGPVTDRIYDLFPCVSSPGSVCSRCAAVAVRRGVPAVQVHGDRYRQLVPVGNHGPAAAAVTSVGPGNVPS